MLTRTKNLIFDLDNTICNCSIFYKQKQNEFAKYQFERTGHTEQFCLNLLKSIDVIFTETPEGFSKNRFPRAFAAASATLDIMMGNPIDDEAAERSWFIGDSVFNEPYDLFDGVIDTLHAYKSAGFNMFILTKGDYTIQMRKIVNNGLDNIFDHDKIYINPQKTPAELAQILNDHELLASETVVIGDSLRDDIRSAQMLGINNILIEDATGTWAYENQYHLPRYRLKSVTELPTIISLDRSFVTVN
jgi:FMN phosphatase YigB (HAD superfamily)